MLSGPINEGDRLTWAPRGHGRWPEESTEHLLVLELRTNEDGEVEIYATTSDTGVGAWVPERKIREMCTRGWE
jgi:hypothetical protein